MAFLAALLLAYIAAWQKSVTSCEKVLLGSLFEELAERGGFEPPVRFYSYNGLANRRFRPLSHLSTGPGDR